MVRRPTDSRPAPFRSAPHRRRAASDAAEQRAPAPSSSPTVEDRRPTASRRWCRPGPHALAGSPSAPTDNDGAPRTRGSIPAGTPPLTVPTPTSGKSRAATQPKGSRSLPLHLPRPTSHRQPVARRWRAKQQRRRLVGGKRPSIGPRLHAAGTVHDFGATRDQPSLGHIALVPVTRGDPDVPRIRAPSQRSPRTGSVHAHHARFRDRTDQSRRPGRRSTSCP